jgi:ADP-ribosylglycohydrolase
MKYDTFDDVVLAAVNLGGDTDTIAAIAGGMAGSFYGVESIPDRWIQILAQKEQLKMMFDAFIEYSK